MTSTFGSRLRAAMKASGLKSADLARLCDVRRQTVGKWLRMVEAGLAAKHAAGIAIATHTDLMRLVIGDEKPRKRKYSGRMTLISAKKRGKFPAPYARP